jgi:hypothetical protein
MANANAFAVSACPFAVFASRFTISANPFAAFAIAIDKFQISIPDKMRWRALQRNIWEMKKIIRR